MHFAAIIFVAILAINSRTSSVLAGNVDSLLERNYTAEELGTCPMNSSISVKVFRNLHGEWLTSFVASNKLGDRTLSMDVYLKKNILECADSRYITISGIFKDTDAGNFSEATFGDYSNNTDGGACDSCKRINELTAIAEGNANQKRKALQIMEQRMISSEKAMHNITETMISFEKTQNNINETLISLEKTQTSFQKTLTNIENFMNEMRGILNSTRNMDTEDKENATTKPSPLNPMSSGTDVKENITTCPPCPVITKEKVQITFDGKYKGTFDREYKGKKIQLSSDLRTATRTRPTENNGEYAGVVSNSVLEDDQVFQIRIDERIEKWTESGIGIGVIQEKKIMIKDASYIFLNKNIKGTWSICSYYNSQSGKSRTYKDGYRITFNGYPLPTKHLPVGTVLGVSRRSDGNVHFFINGVDKGAAFTNVPKDVYAFVDIIHYVTKISIVN